MDREKIIEALQALLNAPDQLAAKKIVEARQEELLSENADQVIAGLLEQNRDNPPCSPDFFAESAGPLPPGGD